MRKRKAEIVYETVNKTLAILEVRHINAFNRQCSLYASLQRLIHKH